MLQNTKEMLLKAKKEKYSVGAFNSSNIKFSYKIYGTSDI